MGGDSFSRLWRAIGFNFSRLFQWHRVLGITGLSIAAYFLVFVVLGKTDVSWLLPPSAPHFHWPDLPSFFVQKEAAPGGGTETVYTVPSRQLTAQELAQLGGKNRTAPPAAKKANPTNP